MLKDKYINDETANVKMQRDEDDIKKHKTKERSKQQTVIKFNS